MKIDYLHGRRVEDVQKADDVWNWGIQLEGGAIIRNRDESLTAIPTTEIIGTALLSSAVDEVEDAVVLVFGTVISGDPPTIREPVEVEMTWSKMGLSMPGSEEELDPSAVVALEDTLPSDPSAERVVDGPVTP